MKQTPPPSPGGKPKKPPIQFSLTMLLVMMVVFSLASAPAYYLMRAEEGSREMQLPGMIVLLTGPMLLAIVVSILVSAVAWWKNR